MENIFLNQSFLTEFIKSINANTLSHAYLFISPDIMTNKILIKYLSSLVLCDKHLSCGECGNCQKIIANTHPDILEYPKGDTILVDDANDINEKTIEKPMICDKKIIVISNIDSATIQAQNKMLKTIEEPPKSVIFFLTATNPDKILPTILSRVNKQNINPLSKSDIKNLLIETPTLFRNELFKITNNLTSQMDEALDFGDGWIGKTIQALNDTEFNKQNTLAIEICDCMKTSKEFAIYSSKILEYKDLLKTFFELLERQLYKRLIDTEDSFSKEGFSEMLKELNIKNEELEKNVNTNIIVDNLLMKFLEIKYTHKML